MNHKTCALCGKYTTLRDSHFIPKFVYKVLNNTKKADTNITIKNESGKLIPLSKQITSHRLCGECEALMNPLMILVKIIKLRWIHILSYDQMVSRKINNQTTRCANSIFYTTLFTNSAPNYT